MSHLRIALGDESASPIEARWNSRMVQNRDKLIQLPLEILHRKHRYVASDPGYMLVVRSLTFALRLPISIVQGSPMGPDCGKIGRPIHAYNELPKSIGRAPSSPGTQGVHACRANGLDVCPRMSKQSRGSLERIDIAPHNVPAHPNWCAIIEPASRGFRLTGDANVISCPPPFVALNKGESVHHPLAYLRPPRLKE